jgi:redox-sensitive bicupin YhaK (pirin superfamily)
MIEGTILHTDSLGYRQWIEPGQVNLMTAGRGISHAEESPSDAPGRFQLAQLWIALPKAEIEREPSFRHYPDLPDPRARRLSHDCSRRNVRRRARAGGGLLAARRTRPRFPRSRAELTSISIRLSNTA